MEVLLLILGASFAAGFFGAIMGIGGGIILVPVLVSVLHVPMRLAIGASMLGVVATSSAAAAVYIRDGLSNLRLGILLSQATVVGALAGVLIGKVSGGRVVSAVFASVLLFAAWAMFRRGRDHLCPPGSGGLIERAWSLTGSFEDPARGGLVRYGVHRVLLGFPMMLLAGMVSGLLGVGGGIFQVPIMDTVMSMPIKAATATSNFMMGITAAAGAVAFLAMGEVHPAVAAPVTVGVFAGSVFGSHVMPHMRGSRIRLLFVGLLVALAFVMASKAVKGGA